MSGRFHPLESWLPPAPAWLPSASAGATAALAAASVLLVPIGAALASGGEGAPDGFLEFVITFIEGLGPWGPAAFVATVAIAESIPLFPTQPLSLASGLLFGAQKGALCMLTGTVLASLLAFSIARGIGRPLAERIISHEMGANGGSEGGSASGQEPSAVQRKLAEVTAVIESGSFWQQAGAVLLLRMTPVVPFSASNYVLGLSPLPLPPYMAGTTVGMAFWSVFYASLGGASRSLLRGGVDPNVLLLDLLAKAGSYTRELAAAGIVLGVGVLLYVGTGVARRQLATAPDSEAANAPAAAAGTPHEGSGAPPGRPLHVGAKQLGAGVAGKELEMAGRRLTGWLGTAGKPAAAAAAAAAVKEVRVEPQLEE